MVGFSREERIKDVLIKTGYKKGYKYALKDILELVKDSSDKDQCPAEVKIWVELAVKHLILTKRLKD